MVEAKELESIISKIEGVNAVKVVEDSDKVKEIHVIAKEGKSPKQVVRDIETAVFALTGFKVDRKIISVAQLSDGTYKRRRIALMDVRKDIVENKVMIEVELEFDGESLDGRAEGPNTSPQLPLIVGYAILDAVNVPDMAISVDDVQEALIFNRKYILTHLTCNDGSKEWEIIGIAPKSEDEIRSYALSVLDAIEKVF
ncbi:MAG: hypothetical protein J7L34_05655 [Thermotogaceae bacterium]|nr:hypothetical protein [Thermotogaceae bacterium]